VSDSKDKEQSDGWDNLRYGPTGDSDRLGEAVVSFLVMIMVLALFLLGMAYLSGVPL